MVIGLSLFVKNLAQMALNGRGLTHHAKIGGMHIVHYALGEHTQVAPLYVIQILHTRSSFSAS